MASESTRARGAKEHMAPGAGNPPVPQARSKVADFDDPYLPNGHPKDGSVCTECGAVYERQHWTLDEARRDLLLAAGTPDQVICPACRKTMGQDPHGVVTLRGDYWPEHRDEILNLIANEERRGRDTNALERVIQVREEDESLVIETTNEKLAQRIGRSIHHAHKGDVEYRWPHDNRLVRVYWTRWLEV